MPRWYRVALRAYPAPFRARFGRDMEEHCRDRLREARRSGRVEVVRVAAGLGVNAVLHGLAERRSARRASGSTMTQEIVQDIRYTARSLVQRPAVTVVALLTLAIGIGANTAIFSLVHALLLRDLPYPQPDRVVRIYETHRRHGFINGVGNPFNFDQWEKHAPAFAHLAAMRSGMPTLSGTGDPARLRAQSVTASFFDVMGLQPSHGRVFTAGEAASAEKVLLLSHGLWTTRFGADPAAVGRTITLDGTSWQIIGVMPERFAFPPDTDLWQPYHLDAATRASLGSWFLGVVGRLEPRATIAGAQAELDTIAARLEKEFPRQRKDRGARVVALHEDLVTRFADGVMLLQGVVIFILLIACVNVANLLLAQATGRRRELAIRTAIGAGRGRLVRQLLTESLLLAAGGAAIGALVAVWGVRALVAASPQELPPGMEVTVSLTVLGFTSALAILTALVFGTGPALLASRGDLRALRDGGRGGSATTGAWARNALVSAEVALAVILLAGAGLLTRSFVTLAGEDVGFRADGVLTANLSLPSATYPDDAARRRFWTALFDRLDETPGVSSAAASTALPFSLWEWQTGFTIEGRENVPNDGSGIRTITSGYFATLGIPIRAGREFAETDTPSSPAVVLVNDAFARRYLAGVNPVGQHIRMSSNPGTAWSTIVGVAGDARHGRIEEAAKPEIYRPLGQNAPWTLTLALKTDARPESLAAPLRAAVAAIDPTLPLEDVASWNALVDRSIATRRFHMQLLGLFAMLALMLAACGIYGVMSFAVSMRVRELAIRLALGAQPSRLNRSVVAAALKPVAAGLAAGVPVALWLMKLIESQLFATSARDPLTIALACGVLLAAGVAAAWLPARRSSRVDPLMALRNE